ncbi:MAG: threonine synthase [Oscillospiraceae bacterium]|jgi:threonine synthase|nr:threonine synthase [Oscillospiraceae bacterium]
MLYTSTRDHGVRVSAAQAIAQGISREGGLFVPESVPALLPRELEALAGMDYIARAEAILVKFLTGEGGGEGWRREEIARCVRAAYENSFPAPGAAPLCALPDGKTFLLELFHGPTCAFKDIALQLLPQLLTAAAKKVLSGREVIILTATSGDTGKAALEGFCDVPGTKIAVFYPSEGVSEMQRLQMVTQEGENVRVIGVRGNFDDAQSGVKAIFGDRALAARMAAAGKVFSSANSINWGRLLPQIVYYISAYCDLLRQGALSGGQALDFVVPTGNFGNILAAYYAKEMGLPVRRLLCASNRNRVLTDFLQSGCYDRRRAFFTTLSPSMDILISSNLERLLWLCSGGDCQAVAGWMAQLAREGCYSVPEALLQKIQSVFAAGDCDDAQTGETIRRVYETQGYLSDTHTAVALHALQVWRGRTGEALPAVVVSTASPFKFAGSVLAAIQPGAVPADPFAAAQALEALSGVPCPAQLKALARKPVRFREICEPKDMKDYILF